MKSIVNEASEKLTKLRDFTSSSVSLAFEAIPGGGTSIRHKAFIRGGRLIQTLHLKGGGRLFESGRLLDHLRYFPKPKSVASTSRL